jgi:hypothetical protein
MELKRAVFLERSESYNHLIENSTVEI